MNDVLAIVLAGGKGSRLDPLTRDRAKPAVAFGGSYRIIDFTLSNCINSHLRRVLVLTQYKALSLNRHVHSAWGFLPRELGEFVEIIAPQQRIDERWYKGTLDALYQNIYAIEPLRPKCVLILGGDHVYKMDYRRLVAEHQQHQADVTIGCVTVPVQDGRHFGIMNVDRANRIVEFVEKPENPPSLQDDPQHCLASMGIYVFNPQQLYDWLCEDAADLKSNHDFGTDLIPRLIQTHHVRAYRFGDGAALEHYWRDVGTIDAYYQANMDLVAVSPVLNLYDQAWPIHTTHPQLPPPKFVFSEAGAPGDSRRGEALESMVCQGCILSGGHVRKSVLSPNVRVRSYAQVEESILFSDVIIGRHCRLRRTIVDSGVTLPDHTVLGHNQEEDRQRGLTISNEGVVVLTKEDAADLFPV